MGRSHSREVTILPSFVQVLLWFSRKGAASDCRKHKRFRLGPGYGHKTWQDGDFPWMASTHKITWLYNHVVLRDCATNKNHYISTIAIPLPFFSNKDLNSNKLNLKEKQPAYYRGERVSQCNEYLFRKHREFRSKERWWLIMKPSWFWEYKRYLRKTKASSQCTQN